jgi:Ca-activated chloride channel homolog
MVSWPEAASIVSALLVGLAEGIHLRRCRNLARLAFGPRGKPAQWARLAPFARVSAASALAWGFVTLLLLPPNVHLAETVPDKERRHILLVLDVSPSMLLRDAGIDRNQSRKARGAEVMASYFQRVPVAQYLISVIACYNGSKPVVVGTKDMEVVRNIMNDLPMQYAFKVGKTDLFSGIAEAAKTAQPWRPKSALLILLSDGDTVPSTGMPRLPASISDVLVVGVGDPHSGSFIDGRQSRQDVGTLRQLAIRLGGTYHDGNQKHLSTDLLRQLTLIPSKGTFEKLTKREYALIACGIGALTLAFLPVLLHFAGTRWRPGVHPQSQRSFHRNRIVEEAESRNPSIRTFV